MKSYTDIEQSKELSKILPIESADMWFHPYPNDEYWYDVPNIGNADLKYNQLPCWSLTALLNVLPKIHMLKPIVDLEENSIQYSGVDLYIIGENLVDACYEMILKLHEQNLI